MVIEARAGYGHRSSEAIEAGNDPMLDELMKFARTCRLEKVVRPYREALLYSHVIKLPNVFFLAFRTSQATDGAFS